MDPRYWAMLDQLEDEEIRQVRDAIIRAGDQAREEHDERLEEACMRAFLACQIVLSARQMHDIYP